MARGVALSPRNAGRQDRQKGVKDFGERARGRWSGFGSFQRGRKGSVKVLTRDCGRQPMVDERRQHSLALGLHRPRLPDEGGAMESEQFSYYFFILDTYDKISL